MRGRSLSAWSPRQLRTWLLLFFLALAMPTVALVVYAYGQLKWEAFRLHQQLAEELAARIDARFMRLIDTEESRSFADYGFLVVTGAAAQGFVQRSPLSTWPVAGDVPGLIGYFQIDPEGRLSTPLLPPEGSRAADYGVGDEELAERVAAAERVQKILGENRLLQQRSREAGRAKRPELAAADAALSAERSATAQAGFDELDGAAPAKDESAQLAGLDLDYGYQQKAAPPPAAASEAPSRQIIADDLARAEKRGTRRERGALPETAAPAVPAPASDGAARQSGPGSAGRIRIFESEIDAFKFALLDSGQFVLYRTAWRDGQRFVQGALLEQRALLDAVLASALRQSTLARSSDLVVAWRGEVLSTYPAESRRGYLSGAGELDGTALYQTRLSAPLGDMELLFVVARLPTGPGATVINWLAAILAAVFGAGFWLMYRLGVRQIALARQQQDFVSAVSHELKTPLTSIRMYGEMLRDGLAPEARKQAYYGYIHDESERLSRLIGNVLQLARMTRNELKLESRTVRVDELLRGTGPRIASLAEGAGFQLHVDCPGEIAATAVDVDEDAFSQVLINLVDNAIKFSAKAERKVVDITCRAARDGVAISVRDYGPGVPRDQLQEIFGLFYRAENELTRETAGTGIGLALVRQLVEAMHGRVEVQNRAPGAEFRLTFPVSKRG